MNYKELKLKMRKNLDVDDKFYFVPMKARHALLDKREKIGGVPEITIQEIVEHLNEDALVKINGDTFTPSDYDRIKEIIEEDDLYFTDFEFVGDTLQRKKYKPFECKFKTSGKIIVENDLREYFKEDMYDINTTQGIIETMDHYAEQGMLHGFVGNSCPSLYLSKKHGEILIGVDYNDNDEPKIPDNSYERLTSVCTDLWWYSIVDLEFFKEKHPNVDTSQFEIVDVPAGEWVLTHKYGISERGYHENLPYATLKHNSREKKLKRILNK